MNGAGGKGTEGLLGQGMVGIGVVAVVVVAVVVVAAVVVAAVVVHCDSVWRADEKVKLWNSTDTTFCPVRTYETGLVVRNAFLARAREGRVAVCVVKPVFKVGSYGVINGVVLLVVYVRVQFSSSPVLLFSPSPPLTRALLLLRQVNSLPLQHMKQRLTGLKNLHVSSFSFLNGLVVLVTSLGFAGEGLVDLREAVRQNRQVLLDLGLLLLLLENVLVHFLALLAEIFDALYELVVVVLESCALLSLSERSECKTRAKRVYERER